ncbi:MAG: endo alpha-1,4 polygalactosaminidase [Polyangiaceae bacterium]
MHARFAGLSISAMLLCLAALGPGCDDEVYGDTENDGGSAGSGAKGGTAGSGGVGGSGASGGTGATGGGGATGGTGGSMAGPGFPEAGPWVSFYGPAEGVDLAKVAATFRIINIDADPDGANFTKAEIATLKNGGKNKVISYLNLGSCESFRSYWDVAPAGFESCQSSGAMTTPYDGFPDEMWADLSNAKYRALLVGYVAKRLDDMGVDGFFLDNLEVVEHGTATSNGPCDAACSQGGLDLVWELRQAFPDRLIVMQNATSDVTRLGKTHGVDYPALLDGISHEEVYSNGGDDEVRAEMLAWKAMGLTVNGSDFWVACEEYAGECSAAAKTEADALYAAAAADGLSAYVTDESGSQLAPCFWADF